MKKLLLLFLLSFALSAKAQTSVYHPFPDSDAVWNIDYQQYSISFQCTLYESQYSYIIDGDTSINGHNYHKLWTPVVFHDTCNGGFFCCGGYNGCIRQDTTMKKVFYIPSYDSTEQLLYDFNLQVGDTIKGFLTRTCGGTKVTGLDSILINHNYRKRWNLNYGLNIIEGIGANNGLLEGLCSILCDCQSMLMCFTQNNIILYADSSFPFYDLQRRCDVITSTNNLTKKNSSITLSPNPFHSTSTLSIFDSRFTKGDLKIYDLMGGLVQQQIITNQSTIINRNGLCDGLYFYRLSNSEGLMLTGKFVVN